MRCAVFFFLFFLSFSFLPSSAHANVVVGEDCDALGASIMTTDQKNIATCLKDDGGKLIWKSMTNSGSTGSWCGMASQNCRESYAIKGGSSTTCTTSLAASCNGNDIMTSSKDRWGNVTYKNNCPSGYTMKSFMTPQITLTGGEGSHMTSWGILYVCSKE